MIWVNRRGIPLEFIIRSPLTNFLRWLFQADVLRSFRSRELNRRIKAFSDEMGEAQKSA